MRRWLARGEFDVLHVHEPLTPSLSMLAVLSVGRAGRGDVPHRDDPVPGDARTLEGFLQLVLERSPARIAVSALARKVQVEHLGGGAGEIPNGVAVARFASAEPLPGWPGEGGAIGFLGRFTEPRKGFPVLRDAFVALAGVRPGLRLLVAGPGDADEVLEGVPAACASGSCSSAWCPRRTRRGCCAASTCTSRPTPAASRSA